MAESEKKLSQSRVGKNKRVDPNQKIEWIQCCSASCGKWRPIPPYMKSSDILESCNNQWYCVLTTWDEAVASCGAPQETGYMPAKWTSLLLRLRHHICFLQIGACIAHENSFLAMKFISDAGWGSSFSFCVFYYSDSLVCLIVEDDNTIISLSSKYRRA